jgi:hypothetical protein
MDTTEDAYGDHNPGAGDVSMCLACGKLAVFTKGFHLRLPTKEEHLKFATDERITKAQIARAHLVGDRIKERNATNHKQKQ